MKLFKRRRKSAQWKALEEEFRKERSRGRWRLREFHRREKLFRIFINSVVMPNRPRMELRCYHTRGTMTWWAYGYYTFKCRDCRQLFLRYDESLRNHPEGGSPW